MYPTAHQDPEEREALWAALRLTMQRQRPSITTEQFQGIAARWGALLDDLAASPDWLYSTEVAVSDLRQGLLDEDPDQVLGRALALLSAAADAYGVQLFDAGVRYLASHLEGAPPPVPDQED
jgi:hypothetical protein